MAREAQKDAKTRFHALDNARLVLIFLVVFGHILEPIPGTLAHSIFVVIYSFHMPALPSSSRWCCARAPGLTTTSPGS